MRPQRGSRPQVKTGTSRMIIHPIRHSDHRRGALDIPAIAPDHPIGKSAECSQAPHTPLGVSETAVIHPQVKPVATSPRDGFCHFCIHSSASVGSTVDCLAGDRELVTVSPLQWIAEPSATKEAEVCPCAPEAPTTAAEPYSDVQLKEDSVNLL